MSKKILTTFWQILFKSLIVPSYKFFSFLTKKINKYLIHNPYLTKQQSQKNLLYNSPAHLVILIITIVVISTNFTTKDIYASELNKKSIVAQLFSVDVGEEIVEKAPKLKNINNSQKTESILNQLTAIKSKPINNKKNNHLEQTTLSQTSSAIIDSTSISFEKENIQTNNDEIQTPSPIKKTIQTYIVQKGDTLSKIAKKFDLAINTILWENNLSLTSYIRPGDKLNILPVDGITYTVRSGDTVGAIAKRYNTTIKKILTYNDIASASKIKIHQKLIIPDGKLGYTKVTPTKSIYASKKPKASTNTGNFIWPNDSRRITQYYHWRHHAIDIGARTGTPIYAPISGRIIKSGWSTGYGYNVVIDNGRGIKTRMAHASKLYVKQGQLVKQGEVVAAVGSTGWSTGPHIHFEIIINGVKVNPLNYL